MKIKTTFIDKCRLILLGVFLSVLLVETGLRVGGHVLLSIREHKNKQSFKEEGVFKIMCLGGSTTAMGASKDLSDEEAAYPAFLEKALNRRNIGVKFKVINEGVCSVNSAYILSNLEKNIEKYKPNMVITMIGLNDSFFSPVLYDESLKIKIIMFFKGVRVYKLFRVIWASLTKQSFTKLINNNNYTNDSKPKYAYDLVWEANELLNENKPILAEALIRKAIEMRPNEADLYVWLGECYFGQNDFKKAEEVLKKAVSMNPGSADNLNRLALCYSKQERYDLAEKTYFKVIEMDPYYRDAYGELMTNYKMTGNFEGIRKLCEKIEKMNIERSYLYGLLATGYRELGDNIRSERYYEKADNIRAEYYKPFTKDNYLKIKELVFNKGLHLVCVQYPVRKLEPLKRLFDSTKGIIFVDNEKIFKDALKVGNYSDYFDDYIGGEFGHATAKGNELLAGNIANVILREVFDKKDY